MIKNLIEQLMTLPGIGPKTAERLAIHIASRPKLKIDEFIKSINDIKELKICQLCNNFSETNPCSICNDGQRDKSIICVIADTSDLEVIESTKKFNGLYFILGGLIDPLSGLTPDKLFIKELVNRIQKNDIKELILAFDANIQGEATINYLKNILKNSPIKISRLARGIPMGSDLEYTDEITLSSALENRKRVD
ncbi:recombination mediator RecR [bacterium]|nr:recombination mediator RecR [bacterium]